MPVYARDNRRRTCIWIPFLGIEANMSDDRRFIFELDIRLRLLMDENPVEAITEARKLLDENLNVRSVAARVLISTFRASPSSCLRIRPLSFLQRIELQGCDAG
jgi:hypothetical protein